jgi:hypothetical protein
VAEGVGFQRNLRPQEAAVVEAASRDGRRLGDDLSDMLYEKGVQYVNTHDFTWGLPQTFFGGAVLRVKAPEKGASGRTLFSVELEGPEEAEEQAEERSAVAAGRFFLKKLFGEWFFVNFFNFFSNSL